MRIVYLILLPLLVWGFIVTLPFLWDDEGIILLNSFIGSLKSVRFLFNQSYFSIFGEQSYRPVVTLSHILDSVIWGKNPVAHHAVNLILHLAIVLFVYNLLRQIKQLKQSTVLPATVLFAVHPLHLETLSIVAYRADMLMTLFLVTAMLCYIRMRKSKGLIAGTGLLVCFIASIFSKETGLVLLPLLVVYEVIIQRDEQRGPRIYFFIAAIAVVSCVYLAFRFVFLVHPQEILRSTEFTVSMPVYLRPIYILLLALRLCVLPAPFIVDFSSKSTLYLLIIQGLFMAGIGLYVFRNTWRRIEVQYSCALAVVPVAAIMHIYPLENFFAGRYMYLPSIGFCLLITLAVDLVLPRRKVNVLLGLMLVVFFACMSVGGLAHFLTPSAFARKLITDSPDCYKAYNYLGTIELNNHDQESAEQFFTQAVTINPRYYEATYNLASMYVQKNAFDLAEPLIKRLIALNPHRSEGYTLMGDFLLGSEYPDDAESYYNKALAENFFDLEARNNLGILYETQGNLDQAAQMYLSILRISPSFALAWANLGNINIARKEYDLARQSYLNALQIEPENHLTWYNLGNAYFYRQEWEKAKTCYMQAIQLDISFADPLYNMAVINVYQKRFDDAVAILRRYVQLRPDDSEAQKMLNTLLNR